MQPIQIVKTYFQSLASGDFATLGSVLDEQVVWHQPGQGSLSGIYKGKDAVFALFGKFMEISEGSFRIESVDAVMANDNLVSAVLRFSARKSSQSISMKGVDVMRVENGKINEVFLFSEDQASEDAFWNI